MRKVPFVGAWKRPRDPRTGKDLAIADGTETLLSNNERVIVVGKRKQVLFAAAGSIAAGNEALEKWRARVRLAKGPAWEDGPAKEQLYRVFPVIVDGSDMKRGVTDPITHPMLQRLSPLAKDSEQEGETKGKKYKAFWQIVQKHTFELSTAVLKWQNQKYTHRLEADPPRRPPGFTPNELLVFVRKQTDEIAGHIDNEYAKSFFKTLVERRLIEDYDQFVGRLRAGAAFSEQAIGAKVLQQRVAARADAPKVEEGEEDPFAEPEEYYTDIGAHPASEAERSFARAALYEESFRDDPDRWDESYAAAQLFSDKMTTLHAQIGDEVDSDPAVIIAPKRCSDMTRFVYCGATLEAKKALDAKPSSSAQDHRVYLDQAGGHLLYKEVTDQWGSVFHSTAVVMADGTDLISLECADGSGALPVGRNTWWFHMYGTEKGMTFAEQTRERWATIV